MNATTFFSREQFERLKADIQAHKVIDPCKSEYGKQVKVNGNTYTLRIHASFFNFGNHEYFYSMWYDYNYPGIYSSRNIGGGTGGTPDISSWDNFCQYVNDHLRRYPDFTEPKPTFEQLSLF